MADLSFSQQLVLTVIDKVALGGIIGVGGFLASRLLERYKTNEAIRAEVAKLRVAKLAEIWEQLDQINLLLLKLQYAAFAIEMQERLRTQEEGGRPTPHSDCPPVAQEKTRTDLLPALDSAQKHVSEVEDLVNRNTFWLGRRLRAVHYEHLKYLLGAICLLKDEWVSGKRAKFTDVFVANSMVGETHADITKLVRYL